MHACESHPCFLSRGSGLADQPAGTTGRTPASLAAEAQGLRRGHGETRSLLGNKGLELEGSGCREASGGTWVPASRSEFSPGEPRRRPQRSPAASWNTRPALHVTIVTLTTDRELSGSPTSPLLLAITSLGRQSPSHITAEVTQAQGSPGTCPIRTAIEGSRLHRFQVCLATRLSPPGRGLSGPPPPAPPSPGCLPTVSPHSSRAFPPITEAGGGEPWVRGT